MADLRVKPTRMELQRMRRRLVTARRGHKLLKDKRDELVRRFVLLVRENVRLREAAEKGLGTAFGAFALARAVMDGQALEEAVMYPARKAEVLLSMDNILSVRVPSLKAGGEGLREAVPSYGYADTSADLDGAIGILSELLPGLLRLAEVEKACALLAGEIEKTRRRVNALEYVMIPRFEGTIRHITMKLDENERGALTRLMKVKEMLAAQA